MNYHHKSKKKYKKIIISCLALILFIFFLINFSQTLSSGLTQGAHGIATPFWKLKVYVSEKFSLLNGLIKSRGDLVKTNIDLKDELLRAKAKYLDLDLLEEENKNLRAMLGRIDSTLTIPAFVLVRPPLTPYDVLILDVGENFGARVGNKVFFENILLGEVVEVLAQTSKIRLFSSGGIETEAFISSVNLPIKMVGRGGGNLIGLISQEVKVQVGDTIIVPGEKNKILGKVEEIEKGQASSFKKIYVRLPINLSEMRWVSIER